ncbi:isochorismatase family protein [Celeribacter litoreus]|uniref:isochorismatase family protein n=1 Tax=Celeribacter litoreus TaxID=2876714 RepID=UPI001CCC2020|nr:isochorismatase family protein [Celeribacter litoreus]MCA0042537.1 isochorismatase family protein [Celeribacter litoreus]
MSDDLAANYKKAFDNAIGLGDRPALVLIDFAQAYYDPECPLFGGEGCKTALESALRIREAAHAAGLPVVLTEMSLHPSGVNAGRFFEKSKPLESFIPGRSTAAFADGLVPREDEVIISKQYPSAFFGSSLAPMLTAMGIDTVILGGLSTSGCVRASCVDSMSYGFRTAVVSDACGDRHPAPHEANLFDMNAKYADVVSEADILSYIAGFAKETTAA